jgi:predicted membrane protein DUF2243
MFNLVEGLIDHQILGIDHVRDMPVHVPLYDWLFPGLGGSGPDSAWLAPLARRAWRRGIGGGIRSPGATRLKHVGPIRFEESVRPRADWFLLGLGSAHAAAPSAAATSWTVARAVRPTPMSVADA